MILCGKPGHEFRCGDLICLLNDQFNVVLFTEHTVLHDNAFKPLGFVVPTHYLSFVKTVNAEYGLHTDPSRIFVFKNEAQAESLRNYILNGSISEKYEIIKGLMPSKSVGSAARPASLYLPKSKKSK